MYTQKLPIKIMMMVALCGVQGVWAAAVKSEVKAAGADAKNVKSAVSAAAAASAASAAATSVATANSSSSAETLSSIVESVKKHNQSYKYDSDPLKLIASIKIKLPYNYKGADHVLLRIHKAIYEYRPIGCRLAQGAQGAYDYNNEMVQAENALCTMITDILEEEGHKIKYTEEVD